MSVRLTPTARAVLGESPSARATEVLEHWARVQLETVDRAELEHLRAECYRTDDGDGYELVSRGLMSSPGGADWIAAAVFAIGYRDT